PGKPVQDTPAIRRLLARQREQARRLLELRKVALAQGRGNCQGCLEAARQLLQIELLGSLRVAEREAAWRRYLDVAGAMEKELRTGYEEGRVLKWDMQLAIRDRLEAGIGLLLCQTPGRVPALVRTRLGEARKAVRLAALPARGGSVELCAAALDRELA